MSAESLPTPPRERWPLAVALVTLLAGGALLALALAHALTGGNTTRAGGAAAAAAAPPAAPQGVVVTPAAATVAPAAVEQAPAPAKTEHKADERRFAVNDLTHVPAAWVARFYPIYAQAQKAFGVNWLLIASVH